MRGREHRAHQAALAQLQIAPTALDLRARPDARSDDGLVTAEAAQGEVEVFGRRDLRNGPPSHNRTLLSGQSR
jgi:hypothetical protein